MGLEYLRDQISEGVKGGNVSEVKKTEHGFLYSVPLLLEGLNGQTHEVLHRLDH